MAPTAIPERTTTLRASKRHSFRRRDGFTLVEILIVLAIISLVMSLGLPAIERVTYLKLNSTTRKFVGTVRTIRNDAILLNRVHRLAIDLDQQQWWVEQQKEFRLLSDPVEERETNKTQDGKEETSSNFSLVEKYSKEPLPMPSGVVFETVIKEREGTKKKGVAYIHFFPNGFAEQTILYLNKEGASSKGYSLVIRPTAGRVDILNDFVEGFNSANP